MPKKDTASAVLGMLSTAGAQTRNPVPSPTPRETPSVASAPTPVAEPVVQSVAPQPATPASVSALPMSRAATGSAGEPAPRTMRLRPETADALRAAWLEAKRDDVLLTAQDFASSLMEDALVRHRRRRAAAVQ
jgi:hypothetical protein